jgi:hypothetical protein
MAGFFLPAASAIQPAILDVGVRFRLIVALSLHLCIETAHS